MEKHITYCNRGHKLNFPSENNNPCLRDAVRQDLGNLIGCSDFWSMAHCTRIGNGIGCSDFCTKGQCTHLGNVLAVIADAWYIDTCIEEVGIRYAAHITQATDYSAFGAPLPGRSWYSSKEYRYGMNTQEKDNEVFTGAYDAKYWEYDSRLGRRWNMDPVPEIDFSLYLCFGNNPLIYTDVEGDRLRFNSKEERQAFRQYKRHLKEMIATGNPLLKSVAQSQQRIIKSMRRSRTRFFFTSDPGDIGTTTTDRQNGGVVVDQDKNKRVGRINIYINPQDKNSSLAFGVTIVGSALNRNYTFTSGRGRYSSDRGDLTDDNDFVDAERNAKFTGIDLTQDENAISAKILDINTSLQSSNKKQTNMDPQGYNPDRSWNTNVHGPQYDRSKDQSANDELNHYQVTNERNYTWGRRHVGANGRQLQGTNEDFYFSANGKRLIRPRL